MALTEGAVKALFPHAATTAGVTVRVSVSYLPEQSEPARGRWFWAYHIRLENDGAAAVQLLTRHWVITDGRGARHSVEGEGVVGEQPLIEPGASFDYVSGCPLATPSGAMQGTYRMIGADGVTFDVAIPRFTLLAPAVAS
ncbi:ApaG protein [Sphingomonas carotinifaciens]|uniref:Protein ApaG n=1 Tax=Sphingomonas carotinifaciens TaxID=1166323 RepID=A0A1G7KJR5_9SPHN|nr:MULTISPECIES: Co2+/Mg2+ efflux protein ApaG [Sphingomonas]MBB4085303.1 ApaG protein [Sphingomonas carotinifaciens]SDF37508.1 ApaG protein [Sphingomonas carotinifaciens]